MGFDPVRQNEVAQLVRKKKLSVRSLENFLNAVPPPTRVQVQVKEDEYYLRIPSEFANVIGMEAGRQFFIYVHGKRKLVIENLNPRSKCVKSSKHPKMRRGLHIGKRVVEMAFQ